MSKVMVTVLYVVIYCAVIYAAYRILEFRLSIFL